jgi:hypothetical protein
MILKAKSRILDKIEKRLTKMSSGIDKRHFGNRESRFGNLISTVIELTIETGEG